MFVGENRDRLRLLGWLLWLLAAGPAQAAMVLGQTRVVVTRDAPQAELTLRNVDQQPLLLQAWVEADAARSSLPTPAPQATPFALDPPVMRLEPGQARSLQVLLVKVPTALPTDRESLFWLNVLEVAAMPEVGGNEIRLDVSVLSRIKLFYRPERYRPEPTHRLRFDLMREDTQAWLTIDNPAPVHQTLTHLTLHAGDTALVLEAPMLAPLSATRVRVPATALASPTGTWVLKFAVIDDDGNSVDASHTLTEIH